jgi:hypothetical protein
MALTRRSFWLLFKVGSLERITALRKGLLYMNSTCYFAGIENEGAADLRGDPDEPVIARLRGGKFGSLHYTVKLHVGEGDDRKEFDVTRSGELNVQVPCPDNVMVFCLSALADDGTGRIPGERNGEFLLDPRFTQFGTHVLLIRSAPEFSARISEAIARTPHLYSSKYLQGGFGLVEYVDFPDRSGTYGLFRKAERFSWQREFRLILGARAEALNSKGALELRVGDLTDITDLVPVTAFIERPLKITRSVVKKVGNEFVEVE